MEQAGSGERAKHRGFHVTPGCQGQKSLDMLRGHCEGHALLRF